MKEFFEDHAKTIILVVLSAAAIVGISVALGITPKDVFSRTVVYEEKPVETGVGSYSELEEEDKEQLFTDESEKSDTITYEEFIANLPEYDGEHLYIDVNHNRPFFTKEEKKNTKTLYTYSELDELGRTGVAYANVCSTKFPEGIRQGDLSTVTPAGWNQVNVKDRYNITIKASSGSETPYLWARCHEVAWAMGGEELDPRNIFTGTVSCNLTMRLYEDAILSFLDTYDETEHVLYRVTPCYKGNEPIPRGILLEGYGVECKGIFIDFCAYIHNVQPGFDIDYSTGEVQKTTE